MILTKESEVTLSNISHWALVLKAAGLDFTEKPESLLCTLEKTVNNIVQSVSLHIKQLHEGNIIAELTGKKIPFHEEDDEPQLLCVLPTETLVLNPAHAIILLRRVRYKHFS